MSSKNYGRWDADPTQVGRQGTPEPTPEARSSTGRQATIETKGQNFAAYEKDMEEKVIRTDASVGVSVSIGRCAPYGAEKWDVCAWCTLPTDPDQESREAAFQEARRQVYENLLSLQKEVCQTFKLEHPQVQNDQSKE